MRSSFLMCYLVRNIIRDRSIKKTRTIFKSYRQYLLRIEKAVAVRRKQENSTQPRNNLPIQILCIFMVSGVYSIKIHISCISFVCKNR